MVLGRVMRRWFRRESSSDGEIAVRAGQAIAAMRHDDRRRRRATEGTGYGQGGDRVSGYSEGSVGGPLG